MESRPTDPHRPAHRLKGHDRREEILAAAERLYLEHGAGSVSTRLIAEAVGISQPSLYAHFATKREITHALSARAFAALAARVEHLADAARPELAHLERMIRTYIDFALTETTAYRIAFMLEDPDPPGPDEVASSPGFAVYETFAREVEVLQGRRILTEAPRDVLAQSIWAGMHGLCALLLARAGFPWAERQTLIDHHVALLLRGARY